jgi:DNA-binding NarL/FixJ family response regulator
MTDQLTVVIGHSSPLVRSLLESALARRGVHVVGTAGLASDLRVRSIVRHAHVVVSGDRYPDGHLLTVLAPLLSSGARVLVVCAKGSHVSDLLFAGASGCLYVDDTTPTEVAQGVRTVGAGQATLHPAVAHAVLRRWRAERQSGEPADDRGSGADLTSRERDVLTAMADGLPTREIAQALNISTKTVESHKARLFTKLGARNTAHAVTIAVGRNLIVPPVAHEQ